MKQHIFHRGDLDHAFDKGVKVIALCGAVRQPTTVGDPDKPVCRRCDRAMKATGDAYELVPFKPRATPTIQYVGTYTYVDKGDWATPPAA